MPRYALLLIAALALLVGASSAQAAAATSTAAPVARAADDLDDATAEDACLLDEDDACLEDEWTDEDLACEDALADDEGWGDVGGEEIVDEEELADDGETATTATDDLCGVDEGAGADADAPELTALSATVAGEDDRLRVQVVFRLDQAGTVDLTLARVGAVASKRPKLACPSGARGAAAKKKAKGKKCGANLPGRMTVTGKAGVNRVELRGRWRGKRLAPGSYKLTATPKAAGATSDTATFKIAAS